MADQMLCVICMHYIDLQGILCKYLDQKWFRAFLFVRMYTDFDGLCIQAFLCAVPKWTSLTVMSLKNVKVV